EDAGDSAAAEGEANRQPAVDLLVAVDVPGGKRDGGGAAEANRVRRQRDGRLGEVDDAHLGDGKRITLGNAGADYVGRRDAESDRSRGGGRAANGQRAGATRGDC